ncbi:DUF3592 domain-containing protein [Microbispora sp. ATCC PTA-5024]|uniref:DUF3592 domain-containing protein n=1 Tax=Microbispora sp. ATCC PTA-5024 TaxID=316330 RepID=UPI0003DD6E18|nr:DUF3592 domain-containing protein [Microbispora sp. ATCC PTA-5024]ETK34238.1 hypothetical protein MPTA5024_20490 [Microbispora sp. ATCC PTA-5024]
MELHGVAKEVFTVCFGVFGLGVGAYGAWSIFKELSFRRAGVATTATVVGYRSGPRGGSWRWPLSRRTVYPIVHFLTGDGAEVESAVRAPLAVESAPEKDAQIRVTYDPRHAERVATAPDPGSGQELFVAGLMGLIGLGFAGVSVADIAGGLEMTAEVDVWGLLSPFVIWAAYQLVAWIWRRSFGRATTPQDGADAREGDAHTGTT